MPASTVRTCIGCRQRGPAGEMVRLRAGRRGASVRQAARGPGGGPRFIRAADCVEGALRPGVLARAFKQPVDMSGRRAGSTVFGKR